MRFTSSGTFIVSTLLALFSISFLAIAEDGREPLFLFHGARALGLGNGFEAVADDINALHYNPAGLAQIDNTLFQFLALRARVTDDLAGELDTITRFFNETIKPLMASDDPLRDPAVASEREKLVNRAENLLTQRLGLDVGLPSFGMIIPLASDERYQATLGLSLYSQGKVDLEVVKRGLPWRDSVIEALDNHVIYRVTGQIALATALAVQIPTNQPFLKTASFGCGIRFVRRGVVTDENDPFEIADLLNPDEFKKNYLDFDKAEGFGQFALDNLDFSSGYSMDVGTLLTPIDGLKVGLTLRNSISGITVKQKHSTGTKIEVDCQFPRNFVISFAAKPLELLDLATDICHLTIAGALKDPNGDDQLGQFKSGSFNDRLHLGAEAVFLPKSLLSIGLRVGNNQGFSTYGATLRLFKFLNLHVARFANIETDWNVASVEISF